MENDMETEFSTGIAHSATKKIESGSVLLTIDEVAALLDLTPATVHRLPLPTIRLGRSLRFAPADVRRLIDSCKEPVVA
jgi:predicted DNA-binding transcriptional regulator AlpA